MQQGLQKLKSKLEESPKHTVVQTQQLVSNIYVFDCSMSIDAKQIVDICKKHQTDQFKEKSTKSVLAWRSDYLLVSRNLIPDFKNLFDLALSKMPIVTKNSVDSFFEYAVDHFWFAIYSKGDSSKVHNHGLNDYACVYYAAVPENSAPLVIPNDYGNITITPKPGMLVIMPSYCDHSVPKSIHEGERIVVAMNVLKLKHKKLNT